MSLTDSAGTSDDNVLLSRTELVAWVNELLKLRVQKIEELSSGAVYC